MLVPHGSRKSISITIHLLGLISLVCMVGIIGVTVVYFAGLGIFRSPERLQNELADYQQQLKQLEEENQRFRQQDQYVKNLQQNLSAIQRKQQTLSALTGLDLLTEEISPEKLGGSSNPDELIEKLNLTHGQLAKLDELQEFVLSRAKILENTPMLWPTEGWISSRFGYRQDPMGGRGRSFHGGIDIAAWTGTPVRATANGTVRFSGTKTGYGKTVVLDHKFGFKTLYAHLNDRLVRNGQKVDKGDIIGRVGQTGYATGSHLHYEVMINDQKVNPKPYLVEHYSQFSKQLALED